MLLPLIVIALVLIPLLLIQMILILWQRLYHVQINHDFNLKSPLKNLDSHTPADSPKKLGYYPKAKESITYSVSSNIFYDDLTYTFYGVINLQTPNDLFFEYAVEECEYCNVLQVIKGFDEKNLMEIQLSTFPLQSKKEADFETKLIIEFINKFMIFAANRKTYNGDIGSFIGSACNNIMFNLN